MTTLKAARDGYVAALRRIVNEKEAAARTACEDLKKAKAELAALTIGTKSPPGRKQTQKAAAKAKKSAAKTKKSAASQGRRAVAQGLRPSLKESIAIVIGPKTMSIDEVLSELSQKALMPQCKDERGYISYALSANKDVFERVARGIYKVRNGAFSDKAARTKGSPKEQAEEARKLKELGITNNNVASNPFIS